MNKTPNIDPITIEKISNSAKKRDSYYSLVIFINIRGITLLSINGISYTMHQNDIIAINPHDNYVIYKSSSDLIIIGLKMGFFDLPTEFENLRISCNSTRYENKSIFTKLLYLCIELIGIYDELTFLKAKYKGYEIIDEIYTNFANEASSTNSTIMNILNYVEKNYQNNLMLQDIALEFNLSVPYISKLFKDETESNFLDIYDKLRVEHSYYDLLEGDMPILEIALKHGFANNQSYIRAYKKLNGELPSDARKRYVSQPASKIIDDNNKVAQILSDIDKNNIIKQPYKDRYINYNYGEYQFITPNVSKEVLGVGNAKLILYGNIQEILLKLTKEIDFKYAHIQGIISDELSYCTRGSDKKLIFRYNLINQILDFLYSIKLYPIISFSFTPMAIASDIHKTAYTDLYNISQPSNLNDWIELVGDFINHAISRYGIESVSKWMFIPWIMPDSSFNQFGFDTDNSFYEFYKVTYDKIKSINENITVMSPEIFPNEDSNYNWMKRFMDYAKANNCIPDKMALMYYADSNWNELSEIKLEPKNFRKLKEPTPYENPNSMRSYINKIKDYLINNNFNIDILITSFNYTVTNRSALLDTLYIGDFIVKNYIDNMENIKAFTYWKLTDFENTSVGNQLFFGGPGMYLQNGVAKPQHKAYKFLDIIKDYILKRGDDYILSSASPTNDKLYLILYNYEHPSLNEESIAEVIKRDSYSYFINKERKMIHLRISNINSNKVKIRMFSVNNEFGNPYDKWISMGRPNVESYHSGEDITLSILQYASLPDYKEMEIEIFNNTLNMDIELKSLEIKSLEITLT